MTRIAIIGAGMAGLTAARHLVADGHPVAVFDKGRGIGGRLATRRAEAGTFDHGAPIAERGAETGFDAAMQGLQSCDAVPGGWRGRPAMSGLLKPWALRTTHEAATRIVEISTDRRLVAEDGRRFGPFDAVIVAIPAPQVAAIFPHVDLRAVEMAPVWTVMASWDMPAGEIADPPAPFAAILPARTGQGYVVHATQSWTRDNLERTKDDVADELANRLGTCLGQGSPPRHVAAHRWRFGRVVRPLNEPFAVCAERVLAGGDWALGHAGHAWESGRAMARTVASLFSPR